MSKKIYFVTGNKNKTEIFNTVMQPEFEVDWYKPVEEIEEIKSISVNEIAIDKLDKAYQQFSKNSFNQDSYLFVTDVGLCISQLKDGPGGMIKRDTKEMFSGDFKKWCSYLNKTADRKAYILMVIVAKNNLNQRIVVEHRVPGYIPEVAMPGEYGFDWDEIFVPDQDLVGLDYQNRSFAQIPQEEKFRLLMDPAIQQFKQKLFS